MSPTGKYLALALLLAGTEGGCRSNRAHNAMAEAAGTLVQQMWVMAELQQRLGYTLDLYRYETGGLPADAAELEGFVRSRFQPAWLDGAKLNDLAIAPGSAADTLLVSFSISQDGKGLRWSVPYAKAQPDYYVVVYNGMALDLAAAATLLAHYTTQAVTVDNLGPVYHIATREGATGALPPQLSLAHVRFVPIMPPKPPDADGGESAGPPATNREPAPVRETSLPGVPVGWQ